MYTNFPQIQHKPQIYLQHKVDTEVVNEQTNKQTMNHGGNKEVLIMKGYMDENWNKEEMIEESSAKKQHVRDFLKKGLAVGLSAAMIGTP